MTLIITSYTWIVKHMKKNMFQSSVRQQHVERKRQRREFRLYFRILTLIFFLFTMGIPYVIFFIVCVINNLTPGPTYADRVCYVSIIIGYAISMLLCLLFTDDVRRLIFPSRLMFCFNDRGRRQTRQIGFVTVQTPHAIRSIPDSSK